MSDDRRYVIVATLSHDTSASNSKDHLLPCGFNLTRENVITHISEYLELNDFLTSMESDSRWVFRIFSDDKLITVDELMELSTEARDLITFGKM